MDAANVGILSVFIAYGVVNIVLFLGFFLSSRGFFSPFKFSFSWKILYPEFIKYGVFILAGNVSWLILNQTDTLLLTYFRGLTDVGLYQAAVPVASVIFLFIYPVTIVMLSSIANLWAQKKKKAVAELYSIVQRYLLVGVIPITLILSLYSEIVINLTFGTQYIAAKDALSMLVFAFTFLAISTTISQLLIATGKAKKVMNSVLLSAIINIILCYLLIQKYGINGAAFSTLISTIVLFITLNRELNKVIKTSLWLVWVKTIVASMFFVGVVMLTRRIITLAPIPKAITCFVIASIVYIIIAIIFKLISKNDVEYIRKTVMEKFNF
jgi:O-antigen/teichoic acid export membrane protein